MDYSRRLLLFGIFLSFASLALVGWYSFRLPPEVPVFYSRPWGKDQLANQTWLFLPPLASMAIFLVNFAWARFFAKENEFLSKLLIFGGFVVIILSSLTLIRILLLVG